MGKEKRFSEELLCAALLAGVVMGAVAGAAIYASAYPIFQSDNWAAWVQAIGSILALAIAIWISSRQINITREIHKNEAAARSRAESLATRAAAADRRSWRNAVIAIVEGITEQVASVGSAAMAENIDKNEPLIDIRLSFERTSFVASITALRSLSLPDLRSYDAVQGIMSLANEASLIVDYIDRAEAERKNARPEDQDDDWLSLIPSAAHRALGRYVQAVSALGGTPKPGLAQYRF